MKIKRSLCVILICLLLIIGVLLGMFWHRTQLTYTSNLSTPQVTTQKIKQISIGTYNVKSLNMGKDLASFQKDVKELDLDILCLQEVDQGSLRSKNMHMVEDMAESLGYPYYYFYKSLWLVSGYYGLGIMSKYPISNVSSTRLPGSFVQEPRILAEATIQVNQQEYHIFNTHLSYENRSDHTKQIAYLKKHIPQQHTILVGDFNSFRDTDYFVMAEMNRINWGDLDYITFRDFGKPDNIYYSKDMEATISNVKQSSFSDHHLLYCQLTLKK